MHGKRAERPDQNTLPQGVDRTAMLHRRAGLGIGLADWSGEPAVLQPPLGWFGQVVLLGLRSLALSGCISIVGFADEDEEYAKITWFEL